MSASLTVLDNRHPPAEPVSGGSANGKTPAIQLDPRTYARALSCVHCGLCLPACPTYTETGNEADSPRGRIQLMRGLAEGNIEATDSVRKHLDLCLDCRGCETACPSGVVYHELIEATRAHFAHDDSKKHGRKSLEEMLLQWMFFNVFVYPNRLKFALLPARLMQKIGVYSALRKSGLLKLLPAQFRKMEQMLPPTGDFWPKQLPERLIDSGGSGFQPVLNTLASSMGLPTRASTTPEKKRTVVGFFPGCIGSVMFDRVNRQAIELLAVCGAEIFTPRAQNCCGAIHHHNGEHARAEEFARRNIDAFLPLDGPGVDFIATNIAGCGAMLREYDFLLRDDPNYSERAKVFASKVRDISEVLNELGLPVMKYAIDQVVTYHDACHLAHAQKVTAIPRQLLAQIPGIQLVALPESDMCCGAAGTYNLQHPEMSTRLAERKLNNIATTQATICATGNVGCAMQISSEADAREMPLRVSHPVELLHFAVFGPPRDRSS